MSNITLNNYSDDSQIKKYIQQQLMPRVFKNIPLNVLNTGAFSIISEYISQATEQMAFTSTFYFNESFITKAILPDSIYAEAAIFDIGYAFATPSCTQILLELRLTDLMNNSTYNPENGMNEFILDKDTQFNLPNGNVYSLDYDILFQWKTTKSTKTGDEIPAWNIQYTNLDNNRVAVNKNRYIVYRVTDTWMCLFVKVSEYKRTRYLVTNSMTNGIPNEDYLIEIAGHICGFDITYIDRNGNRTPLQQDHILPIHGDVRDLQPYVHYIMDNPNTIRLMFQMAGNRFFIPQLNSQYEITVYTSHGMAANFTEAPTVQPSVITATSKYPNNANVMKAAFCISGSLGGTDIGNADTVRRETIEAYNTANVISTDHDIDEWFKTFYFKNILYPYFYKRRDDPWGRIWSGYLALKDEQDNVYRTNTLHGKIPYKVLEDNDNGFSHNEIIIPPGWIWTYGDDGNRYTVYPYTKGNGTNVETARSMQLIKSNTNHNVYEQFIFANPFGIRIQKDPFAIAYFNPWIHTIVAPHRVEKMNTISVKDMDQDDVTAVYHATPIDVEITRTYKDDCYRLETYIDPSQLNTVGGKPWVNHFLKNMETPDMDDALWNYFQFPRDLYAESIPLLIRTSDDGYLPFDPNNTFLCVRNRNYRNDDTITLTDVWVQDNTDINNAITTNLNIANIEYLYGLESLWGNTGINESVNVVGDTRILCSGIVSTDFVEFVRHNTLGYYVLKLKDDLKAINEDGVQQSIDIIQIAITVDSAYKTERHAYGESSIWNAGEKYHNVTLNVQFKYVFTKTTETDDGIITKESSAPKVETKTYTIQNAVDVCIPYDNDATPDYGDGQYTFYYPVTGDGSTDDPFDPGTIITYATMRSAPASKTIDYYRISFSALSENTPMLYMKTRGLSLMENNLRVVLHAYINGSETGHVEMLPVERDTDGTYLFRADMYPMNELIDIDGLIHISSLEYGGGSWIPAKSGTVVNIDATAPELRMSILFKSESNPTRVSEIVSGDSYTGYLMNDQYHVNGFSLIQELKEMRSVVNFGESSIPTQDQLEWYHTLMNQFYYQGDNYLTLYQLHKLADDQKTYKVPLTQGMKETTLPEQCELILNQINKLMTDVIDSEKVLTYANRVILKNGWNKIVDVITMLKSGVYEELFAYDTNTTVTGTAIPCYVKTYEELDDDEILDRAYQLFKEDHPQYANETDEDYEERLSYRWNDRMKVVYSEDIKQSIHKKDYSTLYTDETCVETSRINPIKDAYYAIHEEDTIDKVYTYNGEKLVYHENYIVWENIYNILDGYQALLNQVFEPSNVNGGLEIQLIPFVEYSLMNDNKFKDFVSTFTQVHKAIEPVIFKRLEGNHYLDCKLVATYGLPHSYCADRQYGFDDAYWPNLSVQISFDVKLYNRALSVNTLNDLRIIVRDYFNRLTTVHTPKQLVTMNNNIYVSHLIQRMEAHDNVAYMKFNGWYTNQKNVSNGNYMSPSVQAIVMKWRRLEDMPTDELERYVPEMFVLEDQNIEINVIDDDILA